MNLTKPSTEKERPTVIEKRYLRMTTRISTNLTLITPETKMCKIPATDSTTVFTPPPFPQNDVMPNRKVD